MQVLGKHTNHKSRIKEYIIVSVLLIIMIMGFMWKIFFAGEVLLPADMINTSVHPWVLDQQNQYSPGQAPYNNALSDPIFIYYPMKYYMKASLDQGSLPLWNPLSFCGYPYNAKLVSEMFNPLDFMHLLMPAQYAFGFTVAFHLLVGGLFTYILCKSLGIGKLGSFFAASVFMFNANTVVWLEFPTHFRGELWIPLILLFLFRFFKERRAIFAILGGIALGLQVLSGYSQAVQFTAIAIIIILLVQIIYDLKDKKFKQVGQNIGGTALLAVIGLGIGISFILPFYRELQDSLRAVQERGGGGSMNFRYLITMLNPNFFGNGIKGSFWLPGTNFIEAVRYSGIATLLLAAIAVIFKRGKVVWSLLAVAAVAVLLNSVPQIFELFNRIIPFFDKSSISRILLLIPFCLAVLAGYGISYLQKVTTGQKKKIIMVTAGLAASFIALMVGLSLTFNTHISITTMDQHPIIWLETWSFILFLILAAVSAVFIILAVKTNRKAWAWLMVPLIVADLFLFGINYNTTSSPDQVFFETESLAYLKQDTEKSRNLGIMGGTFNPNSLWIHGLEDIAGYDPVMPYNYAQFWAAFQGSGQVRPNGKVGADKMYANFLALTNTKYVTSYAFMQEMGYFYNNMDKNLNQHSRENSVLSVWNFMEHIIPTIEVSPDSAMEFEYLVPASSELVFYNAIHPDYWSAQEGDGVIFRVYIQQGDRSEMIFEQDLNPIQVEDDRRWFVHRIDLSGYGDRQVKIVFQTASKQNSENDKAGWGNPTIIPKDSLGLGNLMLNYNKEVKIYRNYNYLPRAYLAGSSMEFESEDHVLAYLVANHKLDLSHTVLLEGEQVPVTGETAGRVEITDYSYNRVVIEAENEKEAYLVLLDRYDPDWRAFIDGQRADIVKANYLFRALYLEPGQHVVEFRYVPVWFFVSAAVSVLVLLISAGGAVFIFIRERRRDAGVKS